MRAAACPPSVPGDHLRGEPPEELGERLWVVVPPAEGAEPRRAARPHHLPVQAGVRAVGHAG